MPQAAAAAVHGADPVIAEAADVPAAEQIKIGNSFQRSAEISSGDSAGTPDVGAAGVRSMAGSGGKGEAQDFSQSGNAGQDVAAELAASAVAPATEAEALPADQTAWQGVVVQQAARALAAAWQSAGAGREPLVVVHLHPPSLGRVRVEVGGRREGRLWATVRAEQAGAQAILSEHLAGLQSVLARHGGGGAVVQVGAWEHHAGSTDGGSGRPGGGGNETAEFSAPGAAPAAAVTGAVGSAGRASADASFGDGSFWA